MGQKVLKKVVEVFFRIVFGELAGSGGLSTMFLTPLGIMLSLSVGTLEHHCDIVPRGLRKALNWAPIIPRGVKPLGWPIYSRNNFQLLLSFVGVFAWRIIIEVAALMISSFGSCLTAMTISHQPLYERYCTFLVQMLCTFWI